MIETLDFAVWKLPLTLEQVGFSNSVLLKRKLAADETRLNFCRYTQIRSWPGNLCGVVWLLNSRQFDWRNQVRREKKTVICLFNFQDIIHNSFPRKFERLFRYLFIWLFSTIC
jgi:hypothetical protein